MAMDDTARATTPASIAPAATSAAAVANDFLLRGRQDRSVPPVDQLKLQGLIFYAQCDHLANDNRPLFPEDIEAWPWGPVVRPVHNQTKRYGDRPIDGLLLEVALAPHQKLLAPPHGPTR